MAHDPGGNAADRAALLAAAGAAEERAAELRADAVRLDGIAEDVTGTVAGAAGGLGDGVWVGDAARAVGARFELAASDEAGAVVALGAAAEVLRRRADEQSAMAADLRARAAAAA